MKTDWDWPEYYNGTPENKEYRTLTEALSYWNGRPPGRAIDLGCGHGMDTVRLLKKGWDVLAVDVTTEGLTRLKRRPDLPETGHLSTLCRSFQDFVFTEPVDLVNASRALPFCNPRDFPAVWSKIKAALKPGGVFCGHFFGDRDSWIKHGLSVFGKDELLNLLDGLEIFYFHETEEDGPVVDGRIKHWHIFDVVAFRPVERSS